MLKLAIDNFNGYLIKASLVILILILIVTPYSGWIDLEISNLFYQHNAFSSHQIWTWIYTYGIWPAWITVLAACITFCLSFFTCYQQWRKSSLLLILTLAIGSGLIIHGMLKEHWGRPRPRQIETFGGQQTFRPYYQPNLSLASAPFKSFACGHCSMGFYFFCVEFLGLLYQKRWLRYLGCGLAWGLGGLLSMARIAQGGHFFSDVLASAIIMWYSAWFVAYFLFNKFNKDCLES